MVDVTSKITITCPQGRVFEYAVNPDNAPKWYVNIKSVEWRTPKPLTLGSKIAFKAQFLGRQLSYIYEIVELIPGQKLVMRTAGGSFAMETTYIWETVDEGVTQMTLRNRGNPTGFSKLFAPFMSLAMKKANRKDLEMLKEILENSQQKR